jgi:cupin fold WbuC family metalloprotein
LERDEEKENKKQQLMKVLDIQLFDTIEGEAMASPRRRMHYDLRTQAMDEDPSWKDTSQRILNVMMADTVIPVHRHTETSETVIVLRGSG